MTEKPKSKEIRNILFQVDKDLARDLKMIAFERDIPIKDLLIEAANEVISKNKQYLKY